MILFKKEKTIFALSILWIIIGIISGFQAFLSQAYQGLDSDFFQILFFESSKFILWIIYIPVILFLLDKYPFVNVKSRTRSVVLHLGACAVLGFVHMTVFTLFLTAMGRIEIVLFFKALLKISLYSSFYHLFSYMAVLAIGSAIEYYRKYVEKESLSLKLEKLYSDARLASLKTQLHPHFLFNVLNNVSMLIRQNKNSEAVTMISQLSGILRHILDNKERNLIPLKEEIDLTQKYLSIESIRFADRLTYKIEVDENIEDTQVPDLILQPVIENAFKHGLAEKISDCRILITAKDCGDSIILMVEDNGCGMENQKDFLNQGNGLTITIKRLEQTYGAKAGLFIDSSPDLYTKVSLKIPKLF